MISKSEGTLHCSYQNGYIFRTVLYPLQHLTFPPTLQITAPHTDLQSLIFCRHLNHSSFLGQAYFKKVKDGEIPFGHHMTCVVGGIYVGSIYMGNFIF